MEPIENNNLPAFSQPQRQSPAAIIIMMLRSAIAIFKTFWPALLVILFRTGKENESPKVLIILLIFGVLTIAGALVRYFFYFFHLHNDNLVIKTGWLKKKTLNIPLKSIQAVHLEQNIWQQVFRVAKVSFDSAGSEKVEARIDALPLAKAEQLKHALLTYQQKGLTDISTQEKDTTAVYRLQPMGLLKLSLSANHLEAFAILLAVGLNLLDDLKQAFEIDGWNWMTHIGETAGENITLAVTVLVVLIALLSIGFSSIRTFIKYYDFALLSEQNKWKISFGLLNRQQRIIPHNKIQVFGWHTNWLRRKINFWLLDIKTIGKSDIKEKQKVKIPLTSMDAAMQLAAIYQQTGVVVTTHGEGIEPHYWKRKTLTTSLLVTTMLIALGSYWLEWQSLWIGILFFYFAIRNYQWYKNFRWFVNEEGIQLHSGLWGRRYTLLRWKKVQQVSISQSIYQRRHQLSSLTFFTAGGGVDLPFIPIDTARSIVNTVLYLIESKEESWM